MHRLRLVTLFDRGLSLQGTAKRTIVQALARRVGCVTAIAAALFGVLVSTASGAFPGHNGRIAASGSQGCKRSRGVVTCGRTAPDCID
jgi:hypothetical protein